MGTNTSTESGTGNGSGGQSSSATTAGGALVVCPGANPPPEGYPTCRSDEDCPENTYGCRVDDRPRSPCGTCIRPPRFCEGDGDCPEGRVCIESEYFVDCSCGGLASQCEDPCTQDSCAPTETCGDDGHCAPTSCQAGYTCPAGRVCDPRYPDARGCSPTHCEFDDYQCPEGTVCDPENTTSIRGCRGLACPDEYTCPDDTTCDPENTLDTHGCRDLDCSEGYPCPENHDCDLDAGDSRGCLRRACESDTECDCGACVMGTCEDRLYICASQP